MSKKLKGLYVLNNRDLIYGQQSRLTIDRLVEIVAPTLTADQLLRQPDSLLAEIEVMFSGWGPPRLDSELLTRMSRLRAVFYGAGSVRGLVTEAVWARELLVCSAWAANAVPVAEYSLATILLSLKRFWAHQLQADRKHQAASRETAAISGAYQSVVGLVSFGMVARKLAELLSDFELKVIAYDPFVEAEVFADYKVEPCSSLSRLFADCDVVSLHTPKLLETEGMIGREHFSVMKANATFINTARGAVVREPELIEVLRQRPDLWAILDVTDPEPPPPDSPLFTLPNLVLTPHIAGSIGPECRRMGKYMAEELERFVKGEKPRWQVTPEIFAKMA